MDDLLDLDWGGSAKAKQPPLTLAQQQAQTAAAGTTSPTGSITHSAGNGSSSTYSFDALTRSMPAAAGSLYVSSRSGTPNIAGPLKTNPTPINASSNSAGTASFADLVNFATNARNGSGSMATAQQASGGGGGGGGGSKLSGMSMLDRAKAGADRGAPAQTADAALWDFDAFDTASAPSPASPIPARTAPAVASPPAARAHVGKASTSPTSKSQTAGQKPEIFSLLDDEAQQEEHQPPPLPQRAGAAKDPFDFDSFDDMPASNTSRADVPNVSVGHVGIDDDDEDDFLGALGRPVTLKPAREPSPPPPTHDRLRAEASSPGLGEGSSSSFRAPSPADGGRRQYQDRSTREPPRRPVKFQDEERAARERDEAILGGSPPASSRRQRDGAAPSVAASLFGTSTEENLLGALRRSLGFSGTKSNPSKSATHTPPPSASLPSEEKRRVRPQPQLETDLFSDTAGSSSKTREVSSPTARPSRRPQPTTQNAAPSRPEPIRVPRSIVTDSSSAISASAALKLQGNDAFKRGAYAEAETYYTEALDQLEEGSLRKIPLLNNRAQSRLKNGEASGASHDCETLLGIIVPPSKANADANTTTLYRPREEAALPEPLRSEINLRDAWAKAVLRRAQASEMLEQWVSARRDWDALLRFEKEEGSGKAAVSNMRSAKEGLMRCEEMISGKKKTAPPQQQQQQQQPPQRQSGQSRATEPRAEGSGDRAVRQSSSTAAAITRAGEAGIERVRQEAALQAAEDAAKLSLKDQVDASVNGWKEGKESNIRGLLASVESVVVWPEFGWKKIGLHELLTDVQVKKAYTRAIAKLHPDKLSNKNTTLEQRMVAGAVFATLNEAFTASQA
ncbi:hypothetical protein CF328_g6392 [Tilletia controversa]|nr:hypothetical protein CF328_g6392 [Tilletia controversa]